MGKAKVVEKNIIDAADHELYIKTPEGTLKRVVTREEVLSNPEKYNRNKGQLYDYVYRGRVVNYRRDNRIFIDHNSLLEVIDDIDKRYSRK